MNIASETYKTLTKYLPFVSLEFERGERTWGRKKYSKKKMAENDPNLIEDTEKHTDLRN